LEKSLLELNSAHSQARS